MKPENLTCPECGSRMVSRVTRVGAPRRFWGCTRFPACRGTRNVEGEATTRDTAPRGHERDAEDRLPSERAGARDRRRWES